jgi:hypothetical protein
VGRDIVAAGEAGTEKTSAGSTLTADRFDERERVYEIAINYIARYPADIEIASDNRHSICCRSKRQGRVSAFRLRLTHGDYWCARQDSNLGPTD